MQYCDKFQAQVCLPKGYCGQHSVSKDEKSRHIKTGFLHSRFGGTDLLRITIMFKMTWSCRRFIKGDAGMKSAFATRLAGSADLYHVNNRWNFVPLYFIVCSSYTMFKYRHTSSQESCICGLLWRHRGFFAFRLQWKSGCNVLFCLGNKAKLKFSRWQEHSS